MSPRFLRPRGLRLAGGLLAFGAALIALKAAWPTANERTQRSLRAAVTADPGALRSMLARPAERARLIALLRELHDEGDERGARDLSVLLLRSAALSVPELTGLVDAAFDDVATWNAELPAWKAELLEHWIKLGGAAASGRHWEHLRESVPVTIVFKGKPGRNGKVFVSGDWNAAGEPSDLGGWTPREMSGGSGRWTYRQILRTTRFRHLYHAVVSSDRWPKGKALGAASFSVWPSTVVAISPSPSEGPPDRPRTGDRPRVRLGLLVVDGASWHVLLPLIRRGLLPNFARLMDESAYGTLTAAKLWGHDYQSYPNGYSALTGKLPFRHGITGDEVHPSSRRSVALWEIASGLGRTVAVINIPETFPPGPVRGALISPAYFALNALGDPDAKRILKDPTTAEFAATFGVTRADIRNLIQRLGAIQSAADTTSPPALAAELDEVLPRFSLGAEADVKAIIESWDEQVIRASARTIAKGSLDFFCAWLLSVDTLSHQRWIQFEPSSQPLSPEQRADPALRAEMARHWNPSGRDFIDAYRRADRMVGQLMSSCENLIVMSDHGFGPDPEYAPTLLLSLPKLVEAFRRASRRAAPVPCNFEIGDDARRSIIVLNGPDADDRLAAQLAAFLKSVRYVPQGQPMFSAVGVSSKGGRFSVGFNQEAPTGGSISSVEALGMSLHALDFFDFPPIQGTHMGPGILAIRGPLIRPHKLRQDVYMPDVAPTALYILGMPLADDMDGSLIAEAFAPGVLAENPPRRVADYGRPIPYWRNLLAAAHWRKLLGLAFQR